MKVNNIKINKNKINKKVFVIKSDEYMIYRF